MSNREEKDIIKGIIQSTGYADAPEGMLERSLQILRDESLVTKTAPTVPILPPWVWSIPIAMLVGTLYMVSQAGFESRFTLFDEVFASVRLPEIEMGGMIELPTYFIVLIPVLAIQFYLMKRYTEGRYL